MNLEEFKNVHVFSSGTAVPIIGKSSQTTSFIIPDTNVLRDLQLVNATHLLPLVFPNSKYVIPQRIFNEMTSGEYLGNLEVLAFHKLDATTWTSKDTTVIGKNIYTLPYVPIRQNLNGAPPSLADKDLAVTARALQAIGRSVALSNDWWIRELNRQNWIESHGMIYVLVNIVGTGIWTESQGEAAVRYLKSHGRKIGEINLYQTELKKFYGKRSTNKN